MRLIYKTKHTCAECSACFSGPTLSDFSYGEFLLWSTSGECRYLNAFEDPTYKEVAELTKSYDVDNVLQEIYGEVACDVDDSGQVFHISKTLCPECGSINMASIGAQQLGELSVESVTHTLWDSLSNEEKKRRLRRAILKEP